MENELPETDL